MFITPAHAQTAAGASQGGAAAFFVQMAPLFLLFIAGWFLLIRPQQKRARALQAMIAATKKNDQVITAGGIVGKVTKVEDRFVEVEIAPNTRIRVVKATLAEVTSNTAKPAND
ncbi:preprotein translocase subunit YajC [Sphingomonas sp.]|jgi:preprotein translocase subunit YajC|uniref:preprotein translocase subunit YajC n=1 Tax=Sphingomonas sp. TaxID=28214 RepID=UPI002D7F44D5|nr:preprotein translocase subunit YajC [Sphingomonas sp.]HEU0043715.1 preprotein translocase subunit YajC [Sphingomonas sp.]